MRGPKRNEVDDLLDFIGESTYVGSKQENTTCYLISDGEYVKIGVAKNLNQRLSGLQVGNPRKLKIVAAYMFPYRELAFAMEGTLHIIFKEKQTSGEWYDILQTRLFRLLAEHRMGAPL